MRGQVIHVAIGESDGFIRAEDSHRYPYAISDWISSQPASIGALVDFELVENRAATICGIPEVVAIKSNSTVPAWKRRGFHIALVTVAVALVTGAGVAYKSGGLTASTSESHGPVKTYQAQKLAKIRNLPTAQGSNVIGELQAGNNFSGRVYLSPDGKSQWIKREGREEYVSIINLAELEESKKSDPAIASTSEAQPGIPSDAAISEDIIALHTRNCSRSKLLYLTSHSNTRGGLTAKDVILERENLRKRIKSSNLVSDVGVNVENIYVVSGEITQIRRIFAVMNPTNHRIDERFSVMINDEKSN